MNQTLVTIRCITYNHAPYIRQCLDGFIMQKTNFRFEAIVHDDASTDGTADIVREYAEKYPDIIKPILQTENQYSKRDGSIRRAINALVSPTSKYFAICEGDDYWIDPLKLQKQVDFLEKNPDFILCYTDRRIVDANNKLLYRNSLKPKTGNLFNYLLLKGNPITTATVCYRYSEQDFNELNNIEFELLMGDYPLWLILSQRGKFKYINEKTTSYRLLDESASHSKTNVDHIINFARNELLIRLHFASYIRNDRLISKIEKKHYKILLYNKLRNAKNSIYYQYYKEAISKYPTLIYNPKVLFVSLLKLVGLKLWY